MIFIQKTKKDQQQQYASNNNNNKQNIFTRNFVSLAERLKISFSCWEKLVEI